MKPKMRMSKSSEPVLTDIEIKDLMLDPLNPRLRSRENQASQIEIAKEISSLIRSHLRDNDYICRWGGEEFLVVVKIDNIEGLRRIANKLRLLVSKSVYKLDTGKELKVTISIGGSLFIDKESINDLVSRSDSFMYESKQTGRNKVTVK